MINYVQTQLDCRKGIVLLLSDLWHLAQFLAHSRHSNIGRMRKTSERVNQDHTIQDSKK